MIKFIYFDVGGVVIKDFSGTDKWIQLKRSIGIQTNQDVDFADFFKQYESEACLGKDIDTLIPITNKKFGLKLAKDYSFLMDFVTRFERNESIWPILRDLKKTYTLGLLTNMYANMFEKICLADLMPDISWDIIIDSSKEHVRKPQPEIYQLAQEKCRCNHEDILFIDDKQRNLDVAASFGWKTLLYDPNNLRQSNVKLLKLINRG